MGSCCSSYSCAARWERPATHYPIAITLDVTSPDRCPPGSGSEAETAQGAASAHTQEEIFCKTFRWREGVGGGDKRWRPRYFNTLHANKDERHKKHTSISRVILSNFQKKVFDEASCSTDPVTGWLGVPINDGVPMAFHRQTAARHGGSGLRLRRQNRQLE